MRRPTSRLTLLIGSTRRSLTEITVTVFDDEDVRVGITNVTVRRVDGGGLIEGHDGR